MDMRWKRHLTILRKTHKTDNGKLYSRAGFHYTPSLLETTKTPISREFFFFFHLFMRGKEFGHRSPRHTQCWCLVCERSHKDRGFWALAHAELLKLLPHTFLKRDGRAEAHAYQNKYTFISDMKCFLQCAIRLSFDSTTMKTKTSRAAAAAVSRMGQM